MGREILENINKGQTGKSLTGILRSLGLILSSNGETMKGSQQVNNKHILSLVEVKWEESKLDTGRSIRRLLHIDSGLV